MSPRDLVYAGQMVDMAKKAISKTQGLSRGAYDADGMRHIVHDYLGVEEDIDATALVECDEAR